MTGLKKAVSNRKRKLKKGSEMDKIEIIEEKIDLIKNEVFHVLGKYHEKGKCFWDVDLILKHIDMHLRTFVCGKREYKKEEHTLYDKRESIKTRVDLTVDLYKINSQEQLSIEFKDSVKGTTLEIDVVTSDLLEGYDENNIDCYQAFVVGVRGSFWLDGYGWHI